MSRLTRDGTAEPVSRGQILRHDRGQGHDNFPCSVDDEQDWQPYPVDPYSIICDDHIYINTYVAWSRVSSGSDGLYLSPLSDMSPTTADCLEPYFFILCLLLSRVC